MNHNKSIVAVFLAFVAFLCSGCPDAPSFLKTTASSPPASFSDQIYMVLPITGTCEVFSSKKVMGKFSFKKDKFQDKFQNNYEQWSDVSDEFYVSIVAVSHGHPAGHPSSEGIEIRELKQDTSGKNLGDSIYTVVQDFNIQPHSDNPGGRTLQSPKFKIKKNHDYDIAVYSDSNGSSYGGFALIIYKN